MPADILPPAPPGQAKPASKDKQKKGLFGGLFKKKEQEQAETIAEVDAGIPPETSAPAEEPVQEPKPLEDINPEEIRSDLGLGEGAEVAEPQKIDEKKFELPDIDAPPSFDEEETQSEKDSEASKAKLLSAKEKSLSTSKAEPLSAKDESLSISSEMKQPEDLEEEVVAEPPKIKPEKEKEKVKEEKKEKKVKKEKKKEKPAKKEVDKTDWIIDKAAKEETKEGSDFIADAKPETEPDERPANKEFTKDLHPDEVKEFAKELERKRFEQEKGIQYEPEVKLESKTPTHIEQPAALGADQDDMLLEESPADELEEIKKRLIGSLTQEPEKPPAPKEPEPISMPEVKAKPEEPLPKPEGMPEEPPELLTPEEKKRSVAELIKNVEKELKQTLKEEQKSRIHKQFEKKHKELEKEMKKLEKEKEKLEKEKQGLEQEKIRVAGKADKYEFKEKQLAKTKKELENDREHFVKTKQEAGELIQKLPTLRKDYDTLDKNMKEMYKKLKLNEKLASEIREKEEALKAAQKRLEQTEARLKEQGFAEYLESELEPGSFVSPKFEEKDILKTTHLELYNLVDECKTLVRQSNIVEAKNAYMELRNSYNQLELKGAEKDMLYTSIRELYDDIKLAEMESPEEEPPTPSDAPDTMPDTIL